MYLERNEGLSEPKRLLREESRRTLESPQPKAVEKDTKFKDDKRRTSSGMKLKYVSIFIILHIYILFDGMELIKWFLFTKNSKLGPYHHKPNQNVYLKSANGYTKNGKECK